MEGAGDRIRENLEYAKGQAREAYGKVFNQDSSYNSGNPTEGAKAQAKEGLSAGKQEIGSMPDAATKPGAKTTK
ncbi:hypothetical protein BJY00DRAFT_314510 [Aspergillus carlsbadensis]|nr:hypothetical protein BJY00DRAFT_314510 [Aspergillus carlsbadensis]